VLLRDPLDVVRVLCEHRDRLLYQDSIFAHAIIEVARSRNIDTVPNTNDPNWEKCGVLASSELLAYQSKTILARQRVLGVLVLQWLAKQVIYYRWKDIGITALLLLAALCRQEPS
jgi:hypothetical protein